MARLILALLILATLSPVGAAGIPPAAQAKPVAASILSASVFSAAAASTCPCSIWSSSPVPSQPNVSDGQPIELGVKFRSDAAGYISGVRFYKGSLNTGQHLGHLWRTDGSQLAEATFSGESASGWQTVTFATPVPIIAGTTYVASYYSSSGYFSEEVNGFAATGVDNAPLHALANGVDGPNGVYKYGASGYPAAGIGNNYWVDVVFTTGAADTTPPAVTAIVPASGATGVDVNSGVTATFSEAINSATLSGSTFSLSDASNNPVPATVSYNTSSLAATLRPNSALANSVTYRATVKGGSGGIQDLAGNAMVSDYTWSFTTSAALPPPPDGGPGGPILIIGSAANRFGSYYGEILRTEGLNEFLVTDISRVTAAILSSYDVVVLGEMPLTSAQVSMFGNWVSAGGNLIAMRPDKQLAGLLGLTDAGAVLANGYLRVDTSTPPGAGIVGQTIQFHGTADRYTLSGATAVATLYSDANTATGSPAVTLRSVGTQGGQAAAFTYDLARSVVQTRQGNPAWSGQERDGVAPIRPDDLFYGAASSDPQPDWVDLGKVAIPQADEQQRLMANLILQVNLDKKPLPRFWYFPRNEKAVVVMTGDGHPGAGTTGRFDVYKSDSPTGCSIADWQCVRSSAYLYPQSVMTDAQAAAYTTDGFEIGLHPSTNCLDWTPSDLDSVFSTQLTAWKGLYPSLPSPSTSRTHCITWSDYTTQPKIELKYGIRLDTNYYYWPPSWIADRPGLFTGSGMPMRFADVDGSPIDVYQATTQMTDESGQSYPFTVDTLLSRALGPEGYYGAFTANVHVDSIGAAPSDAIVSSALSHSVPIVSALQMLNWLDGRNGSSFSSQTYDGTSLNFAISVAPRAAGLVAMLPATASGGQLRSISHNGTPVAYTTETIKGIAYALFQVESGPYQAVYGAAGSTLQITGVNAAQSGPGTASITWTTNVPANSRVDYGTAPTSLTLNVQDAAAVTSHNMMLTGLAPSTTYYYRVTSTDAALNTVTSPPSTSPAASFTVGAANPLDHFTLQTIASPQYAGAPFQLTVTARDAAGNLVTGYTGPATLADSTHTIAPAVTGAFSGGQWSGSVTIGQAGNAVVITASDGTKAGSSNSFVVAAPQNNCPCSIWSSSTVPAAAALTDYQPIELGVKFRTTVDGAVTGVRFYKGTQNTGTHVGHLWTAGGTQMAEATFSGESASGWQTVMFASPVAVTANTTYIASYYSPSGYFAMDGNYFTNASINSPPLVALQSGLDGPNGVFRYGPSGFPSSGSTSNYWVDVVFTTANATAYSLNINVLGSGTVTKQPNQATYQPGDVVQLTATPAAGASFTGWSGALTGTANPASITMDGNKTVTATFTPIEYALTVNVVGSGTVTKQPNQATYQPGDVVQLTATPAAGASFTGWSGALTGTANPASITMDGNKTVTANFASQAGYALTVNVVGSGTVTKQPDQATYQPGDVVQLTATPAAGSSFTGWSGALTGTANPASITMDGNKTVAATFTAAAYTLTINTLGNGVVTVQPSQATYHNGDVVQLTATPGSGASFAGWSGDLTGASSPAALTIDGNKTVTASFSNVMSGLSNPVGIDTTGGSTLYTALAGNGQIVANTYSPSVGSSTVKTTTAGAEAIGVCGGYIYFSKNSTADAPAGYPSGGAGTGAEIWRMPAAGGSAQVWVQVASNRWLGHIHDLALDSNCNLWFTGTDYGRSRTQSDSVYSYSATATSKVASRAAYFSNTPNEPYGIAVRHSDQHVFVTLRSNGRANRGGIFDVTGNKSYFYTQISDASDLDFDSQGNLYILFGSAGTGTQSTANSIQKRLATTYNNSSNLLTGLAVPQRLVIDSQDNVLWTETNSGNGLVREAKTR